MINQERLFEGKWAIVSTYIEGTDVSENGFLDTVLMAAMKGIPVEVIEGRWAGIPERSLLLRGDYAAEFARAIAKECSQVAYIVAQDGIAHLVETETGITVQRFTKMQEVTTKQVVDGIDYSETGRGFRFVLK